MMWSRTVCFMSTRLPQRRFIALRSVARSISTTLSAGIPESNLRRVASSANQVDTCISTDNVNKHSSAAQSAAMPHYYWDADDIDVDFENIHRYTKGGFHPIRLGDVFSSAKAQYRVLHKLGQGSFSTVWLAETLQEPSHQYVALKVCVADGTTHELEIFNRLSRAPQAPPNIMQLLDHFSLQGPNGVHTVLVSNVLGNLPNIIESPNAPRRNHVRRLCHEITVGLAALHRQGIVHGDLHPGNVGISLPTLNNHPPEDILLHFDKPECVVVLPKKLPAHPEELPPYLVTPFSIVDYLIEIEIEKNIFDGPLHAEIMDFGNAIIVNEQSRPVCTAEGVRAPELSYEGIVRPAEPGSPPTQASDIWSLACTIYELVSGHKIFLFPFPSTMLGRMATLCGEAPQEWEEYWESESQGELRRWYPWVAISHANAEAEWQSRSKYFTEGSEGADNEADVKELFALLRSMLVMDPTRRPSAEEVSKHPWFNDKTL